MNSIEFIGYHGTKIESAKAICQHRKFKPSQRSSEWLGKGIYFFKDDIHQAYFFAKVWHKKEDKDISVLSTNIVSDVYFDMSITAHRNVIEELLFKVLKALKEKTGQFYNKIIEVIPDLETVLQTIQDNSDNNANKKDYIDGYILDILYNLEPYDLVLCPFEIIKKKNKKKSTKFKLFRFIPTQIQVCVKNDRCIDYNSLREVERNEYKCLP